MKREHFSNRQDMEAWAGAFAKNFARPCLILLDGELGAGKTQTVRWFCAALGAADASSPTFAIHNEYRTGDLTIDHVDLYRVKSDEDLENSGFWELLTGKQRLLFIEWADRLPADVWPDDWMNVILRIGKVSGQEEARIVDWEITKP